MKCISILQPHAWAIVAGPKRVENRTWPSPHVGPLLIHAGRSRREFVTGLGAAGSAVWREEYPALPEVDDLPFGAVIGIVRMWGCRPVADVLGDRYAYGPWCHLYRDPLAFADPIPCRGRLGLFDLLDVPDALRDAIARAGGNPP